MLDVERLVRELRRQKQKYHAKVLTDSAVWVNWLRVFDISDLFWFDVDIVIPELTLSLMEFAVLLDIPPIELEPVNLEFEIRLPTLEELLQGIYFVADREKGKQEEKEEHPWTESSDQAVEENVEEEAARQINATRPRKCYYGVSAYGSCYLDPAAVREFLRATFTRLVFERRTPTLLASDVRVASQALNLNYDLAYSITTRLLFHVAVRGEAFVLGYSMLGRSYLRSPDPDGLVTLTLPDAKAQPVTIRVGGLDHIHFGFILGVTPLGFGVLVPRESLYRRTRVVMPTGREAVSGPPLLRLMTWRMNRLKSRLHYTAVAFANYARPEERRDYLRSERADQWYELQMMRYLIENVVEGVVSAREPNPVRKRMYKTAALQLVSLKAKRHRWGYSGFQAMTEEEFYRWWRDHWASMGLNPALLDEIYRRLKPILPRLRWEKWWKGERLRLSRFRAARLASL